VTVRGARASRMPCRACFNEGAMIEDNEEKKFRSVEDEACSCDGCS
jgi:hypothetical protein